MTLNFSNLGLGNHSAGSTATTTSTTTSSSNSTSPSILYISFNQDAACFSVGTTRGFCIYNTDPFKETYRRSFPGGGIGIVEMMWRSNILALVGGGSQPCFPKTHVMVWDDNQISCIGELRFPSEVKAVRLRRDKVIVALEQSVHVYRFHPLDVECILETGENPLGMVGCCFTGHVVVAALAKSPSIGSVALYNLNPPESSPTTNTSTTPQNNIVTCHTTPIMCMAVSHDGALLATASEKGTLIRVFDTASGEKIKEVRRGSAQANIYSLAFSPDHRFVACGSDTGTVHVFCVFDESNTKGALSFMSGVSSYFGSEWAFTKFHDAQLQGKAVIVSFPSPNTHTSTAGGEPSSAAALMAPQGKLFAITSDATFLLLRFDAVKGGPMTAEKVVSFADT